MNLVGGQSYEAAIAYLAPFVNNNGGFERAVYKKIEGNNLFIVPLDLDLPRILSVDIKQNETQISAVSSRANSDMDIVSILGEFVDIQVNTTKNVDNLIMVNPYGYRVDLRELAKTKDIRLTVMPEDDRLQWSFRYQFSGLYNKGNFQFIAVHPSGIESAVYEDGRYVNISFRENSWHGDITNNILTIVQDENVGFHYNDVNYYSLWLRKAGMTKLLYGDYYDGYSKIFLSNTNRQLMRKWSLPDDLLIPSGTYEYGVRGRANSQNGGNYVDYKIGEFVYDGGTSEGLYEIRYIGEDNPNIWVDSDAWSNPNPSSKRSDFKEGDAVYVDLLMDADDIETKILKERNWARIRDENTFGGFFYIDRSKLRQEPMLRFIWPVANTEAKTDRGEVGKGVVSSYFGYRRYPAAVKKPHDGIDIGVSKGTSVFAAAAGEIIFAGSLGSYGKRIVIRHDGYYYSTYNHLDEFIKKAGDKVEKNELIAKSGNSPGDVADHLHFELIYDEDRIADKSGKATDSAKLKCFNPIAEYHPSGRESGGSLTNPNPVFIIKDDKYISNPGWDKRKPIDINYVRGIDYPVIKQPLAIQPSLLAELNTCLANIKLLYITSFNSNGDIINSIMLNEEDVESINEVQIPYSTEFIEVIPYLNSGQTKLTMTVNGNLVEPEQSVAFEGNKTTVLIETADDDNESHNFYSFILNKEEPEISTEINGIYLYDAEYYGMDTPVFVAEGDDSMIINIPKSVNSISINIATESPYAQVHLYENDLPIPYLGEIPLIGDNSTFTIRIIAEDGSEQEYSLNVIRSETYSDNTDISAVYISAYNADGEFIYTSNEDEEFGSIVVFPDENSKITVPLPQNTAYYYIYAATADYYAKNIVLADDEEVNFSEGGILPGQTPIIRVIAEDSVTTRDYTIQTDEVFVCGKILSYNPKNPTTLRLKQGDIVAHTTTIPAIEAVGQLEQEFKFEGVGPGVYTLEITKPAHTKFTVNNIIVFGDIGLDLTQDSREAVRRMTLRCGDLNGDGVIDDRDLTILWLTSNYYRNTAQAANPLCDFNGDGVIDDRDLTILWLTYNYYRGEIVIP